MQQKFHGRGNTKTLRRPHHMHHNKTGPKHVPNGVPPHRVPLYYCPPRAAPLSHPMVPIQQVSGPGYLFPPGSFPSGDAQLGKFGSVPAQAFVPPVIRGFQPPPPADSSAHDSFPIGRRPSTKGERGKLNPSWNNPRPVASNNVNMQQATGPRPFIRPPFFGPSGFVDGANFQGN